MRPLVLLALSLLLPLAVPPATAQAGEAFLTDGTGDVRPNAFGPAYVPLPVPLPEAAGAAVDLTSLTIEETEDDLVFHLTVADITAPTAQGTNYGVVFDWAGLTYGVVAGRSSAGFGWNGAALFLVDDGRFEYQLDLESSVEGSTLRTVLPRVYVLGADDQIPMKGDAIENVFAYANTYGGVFLGVAAAGTNVFDIMPDDPEGAPAYTFLHGGDFTGHLRLVAPDSVRVSNGGATTFVFQVTLRNTATFDDDVHLAIADLPTDWTAKLQTPVRVPAGAERPVVILVSVPFAHEHGGFSSFTLKATSGRDPGAFAANRLGVLHTPVPMPAGHHPDLFLHARNVNSGINGELFPFAQTTMSTAEDHSADIEEAPINDWSDGVGWRIELEPALRMGLDFDVEKTGTIAGAIHGRQPIEGSVRAELWITRDDEDETLLAESDVAALALDPQTPTPFTLTLTPTGDADYVPYDPSQGLRLRLRLDGGDAICCGTSTSPLLRTGEFKMTLPLLEYHDRLSTDGGEDTLGGVSLLANGPVEKAGRPGDLLTYTFELRNDGNEEATFLLETAGTDASLGSLAPSGEVTLGAGETQRVVLGVRVPQGDPGTLYEVLVFVRDVSDPSVSAIGRTSTGIALGADAAPDESEVFAAAQAESKDAPGFGLALVVGAAAVALATRRGAR